MNIDGGTMIRFGLVLSRIGGMIAVMPVAWSDAPPRARAALAMFAAVLVVPSLDGMPEITVEHALPAAPMEVMLGVAIGMVPRMLTSVSQMIGDLLTPLFGLNAALLFGAKDEGDTALARLVRLLVGLIAVGLGLHRIVLAATLKSFALIPPGAPMDLGLALGPLAEVAEHVVLLGLRLSMPLIAIHLAMQTALAFISRAAPAMQIFSIGFAVSIVVGTLTFIVLLPDLALEVTRALGDTGPAVERILLSVMRQ